MSLWTCIACSARRAVGLLQCPHCGASAYEEGDTVSGPEGVQGQRHVPPAYADTAPVAPAQTTPGTTLTVIPEMPAPAPEAPADPPASTP